MNKVIYNKTKKLKAKIADSYKKLQEIQAECSHDQLDSLELKFGSNTGGYDGPNFDIYWVDVHCLDCDKRMSYDSKDNKEEYRSYSSLKYEIEAIKRKKIEKALERK